MCVQDKRGDFDGGGGGSDSASEGGGSSYSSEAYTSSREYGNGDEDSEEEDGLEAYDLWDEQDDLAKVPEPVYLDQLIQSK